MISYCKYGFIFPSNLNNQLDFVVAKQDESEGGSVSKSSLFLVFDLYLLYNIMWDKSYKVRLLFCDFKKCRVMFCEH